MAGEDEPVGQMGARGSVLRRPYGLSRHQGTSSHVATLPDQGIVTPRLPQSLPTTASRPQDEAAYARRTCFMNRRIQGDPPLGES